MKSIVDFLDSVLAELKEFEPEIVPELVEKLQDVLDHWKTEPPSSGHRSPYPREGPHANRSMIHSMNRQASVLAASPTIRA